jgi:hypothetical protein
VFGREPFEYCYAMLTMKDRAVTVHDPITVGLRSRDLQCALHTVEVEIGRYEAALMSTSERRLGIAPELRKLRTYRSEILDKLEALP